MSGMVPSSGSVLGPHVATNMLHPATTQATVQQPRAQGRVFAISQHEARTSNAVVEGMITLSGHTAQTLFDSGATYFFLFPMHLLVNWIKLLNI